MGALYGALAALSIGLGDLFGRLIVNRRGANVAAMMIQTVGTVVSFATMRRWKNPHVVPKMVFSSIRSTMPSP